MRVSSGLCLLFGLLAAATPASPPQGGLEKRRDRTCTRYPTANKSISVCRTASAFCTDYLSRAPNTQTVYTTTQTSTSTPPVVTVKATSTAGTSLVTVYTSTTTITRVTGIVLTKTVTSKATRSDTVTTTSTVTPTSTTTETQTISQASTTTVWDCTSSGFVQKRAVQTAQPPSCGVASLPAAQVSGACACYLDTTTSVPTTTTTILAPSSTTQTVLITGTTTISAVSTKYVTSTSVSTATAVKTTTVSTVTAATQTVATTITDQPVVITSSITTTVSQTVTEATPLPSCEPDDTNDVGNSTFRSECNVQYQAYLGQRYSVSSALDCMSRCVEYNSLYEPWHCVGISFKQTQCDKNCYLIQGFDPDVANLDPEWQSAHMLSPALADWGNTCRDGSTQFGDIYYDSSHTHAYTALCGMDVYGGDSRCFIADSESACVDACARDSTCKGVSSFEGGDKNCCLKSDLANSNYSENNGSGDVFVLKADYSRHR